MSDQTSLDLLHDIVQAEPVGFWPPAPGWYVLAAILSLVLLVVVWRYIKRWHRDRYRRLALKELQYIKDSGTAEAYRELPALLKRTALSVWPRQEVASLSGLKWHEFLDHTSNSDQFCSASGQVLNELSYQGAGDALPTESELSMLLTAAEHWLRRHHSVVVG